MIDEAALKGTRYEPVAIDLEYRPPQATIDPNRDAGWVRRVRPLLRARWHAFGIAIAIGVVALVVQVQIPAVLRSGIDDALGDKASTPLSHYVWILLGLAVSCSAPVTSSRPICAPSSTNT